MNHTTTYYLGILKNVLQHHGIETTCVKNQLCFSKDHKQLHFLLADEYFVSPEQVGESIISLDYLAKAPEKMEAIILSKLHLNATVFARNCEVKKIDKKTATEFLDKYHLMGATQSGFNIGLVHKTELLALASFSKGRKMNRLPENKRSFELIRFCSKSGITITGGLTKLLKHFYMDKEAGDIMTYVDKQLSDGEAFIRAGFEKHSDMPPNYFLINRKTFDRTVLKDKEEFFDVSKFYRTQNLGSLKLVYK